MEDFNSVIIKRGDEFLLGIIEEGESRISAFRSITDSYTPAFKMSSSHITRVLVRDRGNTVDLEIQDTLKLVDTDMNDLEEDGVFEVVHTVLYGS